MFAVLPAEKLIVCCSGTLNNHGYDNAEISELVRHHPGVRGLEGISPEDRTGSLASPISDSTRHQLVRMMRGASLCIALFGFANSAGAAPPTACKKFDIDPEASKPMQEVTLPPTNTCTPKKSNRFPLPDPSCSPGAINPTLTVEVLRAKGFTTKCVREQATSAAQKRQTYTWYKIKPPKNNSGKTQTCELDHIISLQLGGADTLDNLWPQCGPAGVVLSRRFFKQKDTVENFLAREVKAGRMTLEVAQQGIATDWTQFLDAAKPKKKTKKTKKKTSSRKT